MTGLLNHWDYPLSEIPNLVCDGEDGTEYVIVRFDDGCNGYEYRVCEI